MVTIIVDTPAAIKRSFRIVDEVTAQVGLVTSEMVLASAALADATHTRGGMRLARHRF